MIIGQTILASDAGATTVYSPWFPRDGNSATFVLDVLVSWDSAVDVTVQTKNSQEADPGTPASGGTISITGTGRAENRNYDFKEWVRFKYEVNVVPGKTEGFAHCRMREPAWETN